MTRLETRIPPPVVMVAVAAVMWGAGSLTPWLRLPVQLPYALAVGVALAGVLVEAAGALSIVRAKTTVNPLRPGDAKALVSGGIYRFTRNPIYVGDLLVLLGWGLYLSHPLALLLAWVFVPYITRFQIVPEERALTGLFGAEYAEYRSRVRRWV